MLAEVLGQSYSTDPSTDGKEVRMMLTLQTDAITSNIVLGPSVCAGANSA